ncbi:ArsR/SmtB family transcription factor [Corynebacterium sp. 335C]
MSSARPVPLAPAADCCASPGFLADDGAGDLAEALRVLGDPARLAILRVLAAGGCGPVRGVDLCDATGLAPATVSHHMARLAEAGFVDARRCGRTIHYGLVPDRFAALSACLDPGARPEPRP